ncbi:MAG TPA: MFS transporter, partial [Leptolinea sp.]
QPFLLNSISTVAAKWFPIEERATAAGLGMVASFFGIALGEVLSPILMLNFGIVNMQMIYGLIAAFSVVLFLVFTREAPPTPPCEPGQETRALMLDGLKSMLRMREIWILLALFLVGMGIFNGISTWIEDIIRPKGFSVLDAGNLAGLLMLGGIFGVAVIPILSDKLRKRKFFLFTGLIFSLPGLIGFTFANTYWPMMISMFSLGFFLMSLAPIGYQYAAEITFPAPEGTSNGLLNLAGQLSVIFIYGMEAFKDSNGSYNQPLVFLIGLLVICCLLVPLMQESELIQVKAEA